MGQQVVNFEMDFKIKDGKAVAEITVPEGPGQQRTAGILSSVTEWLGKRLGRIVERHVGRDENGQHVHGDGTVHNHSHGH